MADDPIGALIEQAKQKLQAAISEEKAAQSRVASLRDTEKELIARVADLAKQVHDTQATVDAAKAKAEKTISDAHANAASLMAEATTAIRKTRQDLQESHEVAKEKHSRALTDLEGQHRQKRQELAALSNELDNAKAQLSGIKKQAIDFGNA